MLCRKTPFAKTRKEAVPIIVMQGKRETITADTPPSMAKLISRCWDGRAEQRPPIDEAVTFLRENRLEAASSGSFKSNPEADYKNNLSSDPKKTNTNSYRPNTFSQ